MRIINLCRLISRKEIKNAIEILHKDYKDNSLTIYVYGNGMLSNYLKRINDSNQEQCWGMYRWLKDRIEIFPYNFKEEYRNKENIIEVIYHELRHHYQIEHKFKYKWEILSFDIVKTQKKYRSSYWLEKDANKFARRMSNRFKKLTKEGNVYENNKS